MKCNEGCQVCASVLLGNCIVHTLKHAHIRYAGYTSNDACRPHQRSPFVCNAMQPSGYLEMLFTCGHAIDHYNENK